MSAGPALWLILAVAARMRRCDRFLWREPMGVGRYSRDRSSRGLITDPFHADILRFVDYIDNRGQPIHEPTSEPPPR